MAGYGFSGDEISGVASFLLGGGKFYVLRPPAELEVLI